MANVIHRLLGDDWDPAPFISLTIQDPTIMYSAMNLTAHILRYNWHIRVEFYPEIHSKMSHTWYLMFLVPSSPFVFMRSSFIDKPSHFSFDRINSSWYKLICPEMPLWNEFSVDSLFCPALKVEDLLNILTIDLLPNEVSHYTKKQENDYCNHNPGWIFFMSWG